MSCSGRGHENEASAGFPCPRPGVEEGGKPVRVDQLERGQVDGDQRWVALLDAPELVLERVDFRHVQLTEEASVTAQFCLSTRI